MENDAKWMISEDIYNSPEFVTDVINWIINDAQPGFSPADIIEYICHQTDIISVNNGKECRLFIRGDDAFLFETMKKWIINDEIPAYLFNTIMGTELDTDTVDLFDYKDRINEFGIDEFCNAILRHFRIDHFSGFVAYFGRILEDRYIDRYDSFTDRDGKSVHVFFFQY